MDAFKVLEPGAFTTVQDRGRYGFQQFGIPISGALDKFSFRIANMLVGNPESSAVLEITYIGPKLEVLSESVVAVAGAEMTVLVNGIPQPSWQSFGARRGEIISFKLAARGIRAYLAVGGGILAPPVMGSRSTCTSGKFGGIQGRSLLKGDVVCRCEAASRRPCLMLPEVFRPTFSRKIALRALPGPQDDYFDSGIKIFFDSEFSVTSEADRMGYRLAGPVIPFADGVPKSIISEANMPGMVQVPPEGQPIIVLGEQTASGYAKIATVITPDLDLVAQARPGDVINFTRVDLAEAHSAYFRYLEELQQVEAALQRQVG
jgi:biotin-dependent carboxylase-like uncharacterized protein